MNIAVHRHLKKLYSEKFIGILGHMLEIDENKRYDFQLLYDAIKIDYQL